MRSLKDLEPAAFLEEPEPKSGFPLWWTPIAILSVAIAIGYLWWPLQGTNAQTVRDPAPGIEILPMAPREPDGLTILVKQDANPGVRIDQPTTVTEPRIEGYAIDLGTADSFSALTQRFASIALVNAELGFDLLEPRATLVDTDDGLTARLLVGPFETRDIAADTCQNIALPADVECRAAPFGGERIARR